LVRRHVGKRSSVGGPVHSSEDNIRMYLKEIGWKDVNWIHLAQDRDKWLALVNMVMNLQVP
jgi:hypothetical protein